MNYKISAAIATILLLGVVECKPATASVCVEWIQPFWELIVLREDRPAIYQDLARFFIFLDNDGNGKVNDNEFHAGWQQATRMADDDVSFLFVDWSILKDTTEPDFIVDPNIKALWADMDKDMSGSISLNEFQAWWIEELKTMPSHGCA